MLCYLLGLSCIVSLRLRPTNHRMGYQEYSNIFFVVRQSTSYHVIDDYTTTFIYHVFIMCVLQELICTVTN